MLKRYVLLFLKERAGSGSVKIIPFPPSRVLMDEMRVCALTSLVLRFEGRFIDKIDISTQGPMSRVKVGLMLCLATTVASLGLCSIFT